jgi:hypothetical protein
MNEADWDRSTDPTPMLQFLRDSGTASGRKLSLFAVACCRRIWPLLADERGRGAVGLTERFADGQAAEEEWRSERVEAREIAHRTQAAAVLTEVPVHL